MKVVNYINMTSGLEWLNEIENPKFIRIQSSLCESKCWDRLIFDLDYDFLINLAQGNYIYVYDTSTNKNASRALYQGIEFIRYVLIRRWFNPPNLKAFVKENDVTEYFERCYKILSRTTKNKLDYVKKFLNTETIFLEGVCKKSLHDGEYDFYKRNCWRYKMKIRCKLCNTIIEGDKKGHMIWCNCGKCAIDETPYYYRIIGEKEDFEEISENKDYWKFRRI